MYLPLLFVPGVPIETSLSGLPWGVVSFVRFLLWVGLLGGSGPSLLGSSLPIVIGAYRSDSVTFKCSSFIDYHVLFVMYRVMS